jgi:putative addiction module component (TIGR02574 family)
MSVSAELLTQLLNLPEAERTGLAHHLLLSLEAVPFDPDSQAAWEEELHRRLDKIEKGQFQAKRWRAAEKVSGTFFGPEKGS